MQAKPYKRDSKKLLVNTAYQAHLKMNLKKKEDK